MYESDQGGYLKFNLNVTGNQFGGDILERSPWHRQSQQYN